MTMHPLDDLPVDERRHGRDVFGVLTITGGAALLLVAAFLTSLALGLAVVGLLLLAVGVISAYEPSSDGPTEPPVR